jgi:hypothetical protein
VARAEWHGSLARFQALDDNRDGMLTRAEVFGVEPPAADLFSSVDVNRDGAITQNEWHWSEDSFRQRDANRDGRLNRDEFVTTAAKRSGAFTAGYNRGQNDGRNAGREDRQRNQGWDLEGQTELEAADAGYTPQLGARGEYQAGYRDGFRQAYREGYGPR